MVELVSKLPVKEMPPSTVSQLCYTALERPSFGRVSKAFARSGSTDCESPARMHEQGAINPAAITPKIHGQSTCWGMDAKVRGSTEVHLYTSSGFPSRAELLKTDHALFSQATPESSKVAMAVRTVTAVSS